MGLYDDDKAAKTSGDIKDVLYWQAKFQHLKLEAALQTRQPEGAIKELIPWTINLCESVLKEYPNHADVRQWMEQAQSLGKKIDPNAPPADFKGTFSHWKDYAYEAGWRSYHLAKMAAADDDWSLARSHAQEVVTQFGRAIERMNFWPEEVKTFIAKARAEMEQMEKEALARR